MAFIGHAGYRMHQAYKGQFIKLLHYIHDDFLTALDEKHDPNASAVLVRLHNYLQV